MASKRFLSKYDIGFLTALAILGAFTAATGEPVSWDTMILWAVVYLLVSLVIWMIPVRYD